MLKQGGLKPWYLEECSSTLATTYSSCTPQYHCIPDLTLNVETGRAEALVPGGVQLHPGHHYSDCTPRTVVSLT